MVGKVVVMDPGNYQAWLSGQVRGLSPIAAGQELFQQYGCVKCHSQYAPTHGQSIRQLKWQCLAGWR